VISRLIYNSIGEDFTEEELTCIRECGVKSASSWPSAPGPSKPADRLSLLMDKLLPGRTGRHRANADRPRCAGHSQHQLDGRGHTNDKRRTGLPGGVRPSNALLQWEKMRSQGESVFQAAAAAVFAATQLMGANFLFYGPMRFAPWHIRVCRDRCPARIRGQTARNTAGQPEHPLYKFLARHHAPHGYDQTRRSHGRLRAWHISPRGDSPGRHTAAILLRRQRHLRPLPGQDPLRQYSPAEY